MKKGIDRVNALCEIADGALIKSRQILSDQLLDIDTNYTRGNPLNKKHSTCKTQIQLYSQGLNYPEAKQIAFTKNGQMIDLEKPLLKLIDLGISRSFLPIEDPEDQDLEDGEMELPGPKAASVIKKRMERSVAKQAARKKAMDEYAETKNQKKKKKVPAAEKKKATNQK